MSGHLDLTVFVLIFLIVAILLLFLGIKSVPQGQQWTVERFGKYIKTLEPGLNLIIPAVDIIRSKLGMMEEIMTIPAQNVITKDNVMVRVDVIIFYQIITASQATYQVTNLTNAILNLTITNIRNVMGSMILDEALSERDTINLQLLKVVDDASSHWGVKVLRVEIKNIALPQNLVDVMARQMKAERDKRAIILEAEGYKQVKILQAEGEKQAVILEAEGYKQMAFRDAEARERFAQAEAKTTKVISDALNKGNLHAINYLTFVGFGKVFAKLIASDKIQLMIMPLEITNLLN